MNAIATSVKLAWRARGGVRNADMVFVSKPSCHTGMISMTIGTYMIHQATILLIPAAVTRTAPGHSHKSKTGYTRSGPNSGPAIGWQVPGPGTEHLPDHRPGDEVDPHVHLPYVWEMHRQIGHQSFVRILSGERELDHTQDNPSWDPLGICYQGVLGPDL